MVDDLSEVIEALARRKLADRELNRGPVANPQQWLLSVVAGIKIDHAGRIATMPAGLDLDAQMRWIEHGAPVSGQRIPEPRTPMVTPDAMTPEAWRAGMEQSRALLNRKAINADSTL